ncbi:carbohydrate ABC transporter membrane protein 1 (CUT1 family) [Hydrogenispora ethanolica]|jgi:raffinose/stachyose/melibiose transport system permease protein|uniref:Carbohydrate ABC transporter membrane protein 1 (CUT1 family) n=1 Tax=Hydrogenispora ethanolica TaxID=1082276 RepID=A0A4R1RAG8_HYDET|nr:sugar ABC transporter permease [Hydrogenispora ethanolica]TCL62725.1 carbohydrate ABC transporter membrane protein 1 (CUT1 family) [Hydrogenispora ethanolica]
MTKENRLLANFKNFLIFAGPTTFIFLAVVILPFLYGIYLTFTNWDGLASSHSFVGLGNYRAALADAEFWTSFRLTAKYVFFSVILVNGIAFLLAFWLTSGMKGQSFFRAGFFAPNLIGGIILGFIWRYVIFTTGLVFVGEKLGIPFLSTSWLGDPDRALWTMIIGVVWQSSGYMMVIYIAGFMNLPKELLEAASIDGANGWMRLKSIVLPLMIPSFIICIFLSLSRGFMVYDINLALTQGEPFDSTRLIAMHVYRKAFLSQQYGTGQAEAFFLFLIIAGISLAQVYFGKKLEVEA